MHEIHRIKIMRLKLQVCLAQSAARFPRRQRAIRKRVAPAQVSVVCAMSVQ